MKYRNGNESFDGNDKSRARKPLDHALVGQTLPKPSTITDVSTSKYMAVLILLFLASGCASTIELAGSSKTSATKLAQLAEDADAKVRHAVARNPRTPSETLAKLAKDSDKDVKVMVACNGATSAEALKGLVEDPDVDVRWMIARHSNVIPPDLYYGILAVDPSNSVRCAVAWRVDKSTPQAVLDRLAGDASENVREEIARRSCGGWIPLSEKLVKDPSEKVRAAVARGALTEYGFRLYASDPSAKVRASLVEGSALHNLVKIPPDVLAALSVDPSEAVRVALAGNYSTPTLTLLKMMSDPSERVWESVCNNRNPEWRKLQDAVLAKKSVSRPSNSNNSSSSAIQDHTHRVLQQSRIDTQRSNERIRTENMNLWRVR